MSPRIRHIVNVGDRSGRLTVVEVTDKRDSSGQLPFRCKCDCGNETMVPRGDWCKGIRKSCGCILREKFEAHDFHIGDRKGKLVVIETGHHIGRDKAYKCRCDCGNEVLVRKSCLLTKNISCGCELKRIKTEGKTHILRAGDVFGKLTVVNPDYKRNCFGMKICLCNCACGKQGFEVLRNSLTTGNTTSCGCHQREAVVKHEMSGSRIYLIWTGMRRRCNDPRTDAYKHYGARGISVCEEWESDFLAFVKWANDNGYRDDLTIDRIDVNGNYCPQNCRWATQREQSNNKRNNHRVTFEGKTDTLSNWSRKLGIDYGKLQRRICKGKSMEEVVAELSA